MKTSIRAEQHKVSIIIPCHNARNTLATPLKSIKKSRYTNLDVLVVDDGSDHSCKDIVDSFKDARFRYVLKENEGPGLARNYGIDHALGEYIFFLDADDEIYPDTITKLLSYALAHDLEVVSGVTVRKDIETGVEGEWFRSIYKTKTVNTKKQRLELFNDNLTTNKLYLTQMLRDKNIYFETGLYEDKLFTTLIYTRVDRIGLIDDRVYIWWVYGRNTSISTSKNLANFKERQHAVYRVWEHIPELRKVYQIAYYINHDLLIYLREFVSYSDEDKREIFEIAKDFIQKNKKYIYTRLVPVRLNRACLDALCEGNREKFVYTADILSRLYQDELAAKA